MLDQALVPVISLKLRNGALVQFYDGGGGSYVTASAIRSMRSVWLDFMIGYLMPNLVFKDVLNIWFVNKICRYTQLNN